MKIINQLKIQRKQILQVQNILVGGAPISRSFYLSAREVFPNAQITIIYGATEVEPIAFDSNASVHDWIRGYPVGKFLPELKIHKRKIPVFLVEEAFELGVEGAHVVGDSIHWTGDLATEIKGKVYYLGRVSELIEFEKRLHAFGIVEGQLEGISGLGRIAFVDKEGATYCYYEHKDKSRSQTEIETEIRFFMRNMGYNLKVSFVCLDKMPVDARHEWKIQRRELKKM